MRGEIISYLSARHKKISQGIITLERKYQQAKRAHMRCRTQTNYDNVIAAQVALDSLLHERAKKQAFSRRYQYYKLGNRPGKLLAKVAKAWSDRTFIPTILAPDGSRKSCPKDILTIFRDYFSRMYQPEAQQGGPQLEEYLRDAGLPVLSPIIRDQLNAPLQAREVQQTIRGLSLGKTPGLDGFSTEYYKLLSLQLSVPLTLHLDAAVEVGRLPRESNEALIVLIPKPGVVEGEQQLFPALGLWKAVLGRPGEDSESGEKWRRSTRKLCKSAAAGRNRWRGRGHGAPLCCSVSHLGHSQGFRIKALLNGGHLSTTVIQRRLSSGFIIVRCVSAGENSTVGHETSGLPCSYQDVNCTDHFVTVKHREHFSRCPEEYTYYCVKGRCRYVASHNTPSCVCVEGYTGSRCERLDLFYLRSDRGHVVMISLITAILVLTMLTVITCVCYHRCRQKQKPRKEEEMESLEIVPTAKTEETLETYLA
ncbi:probetacellulin [Microcaecilia unicolor]|uniref:Probetacellulin n=1 Tax=Microcaecilia unicolor TaxID=1415580 RepID=A0A6P7X3P0_9AMPH|nr:probetacellulin [Microcaecilia unicolor]